MIYSRQIDHDLSDLSVRGAGVIRSVSFRFVSGSFFHCHVFCFVFCVFTRSKKKRKEGRNSHLRLSTSLFSIRQQYLVNLYRYARRCKLRRCFVFFCSALLIAFSISVIRTPAVAAQPGIYDTTVLIVHSALAYYPGDKITHPLG